VRRPRGGAAIRVAAWPGKQELHTAAKDVRILTVDHYHIADSHGASAVLEFLNGEEIVYTGEDLPISVLTNSTYSASIHDWNNFHKYGFHASEKIYGYPFTTEWSFVFDTKRLHAYFKTHSHKEMKYFDLSDFDSSCTAPIQMLSVQSSFSGEVFPYFEDVTFEAACEHYRHFKESFQGVSPSQTEIENEVRYYMSFECVGIGDAQ
jgi:penicillin V acylase-like amidase (Ntn superfamily)